MAELKHYDLLISKLDAFIRKYYLNQLIKGSLLTIGLVGMVFLIFSLGENFLYLGQGGRKVLFWSFIGLSAFSLSRWVITPLLHYFRLGAVISHDQAAAIIGRHFADVEDKLLNVLQLRRQLDRQPEAGLLLAGIEQKTEAIRLTPFSAAIDLSRNRRYLRYALPPLLILLSLILLAPSLIREPAARIIANNRDFEKPAPFRFILPDEALRVSQYSDFELVVRTEGNVNPQEVFIAIGDYEYRLRKLDNQTFAYTFNNVNQAVDFQLFSGPVRSPGYRLEVLLKPAIQRFEVSLDYPAYTGRQPERLANTGDLSVPLGTRISWLFLTSHTDSVSLRFGDEEVEEQSKRQGKGDFIYNRRASRDEVYTVYLSNRDLPRADSVRYHLNVVPDLHPAIQVQTFTDSLDPSFVYFAGDASDDYGLTQLLFHTQITREDGKQEAPVQQSLPFGRGKDIRFDHALDIRRIGLRPGDELTYFFEIWDNDGINGRKASRTHLMRYSKPTAEAYDAMEQANSEQIKDKMMQALEESRQIQKDIKKLNDKMLQEKEINWQQRKELEKLLERRKEIQKEMQEARDLFEQNLRNQEEFSRPNEELLKKQEMVQKMFEELLSEEMKEMIRQLEEMLQEVRKEEALQKMEEMKLNEEELSKELDRMMELYKELELEKDIQDQLDKLEELAREQEDLAEKTQNQDLPQEELQKKQEAINEAFEKMQEKMEDILKRNEELESPKQLGDPKEHMEDISKDLNQSEQDLKSNQNGKASKKQKDAAKKMKDMSQSMQMNMESGEMEEMEEDMKALRQLLENLVTLSFGQEDLIAEVGKTAETAPRYVQLVQVQKKLQDDFRLVEDSLHALSKRVIQIETFVTEKVTEIKGNMQRSVSDLEERRKPQAAVDQQFAMKNLNDLALMLSEVMDQMQQDMSSMMAGSQNCKKPGGKSPQGGKPSDKMSQGQKSVNQLMKEMQERMKNGQGGSSKEFAQMAAQQAAMRKALEALAKEKRQSGKPDKELQDIIDQMDRSEIDLVNKRLTAETMRRQEDILKKLLDHEKAEREREMDEQRKSETASQYERKMPPALEEYLRKREAELELYRTVSPSLRPHYKHLVEEYQRNLKNSR
jgi:hypothetical protein